MATKSKTRGPSKRTKVKSLPKAEKKMTGKDEENQGGT
jgi:hypothetical protein